MDFHVAVPGPFTYLVHEHARSIIAIQELQQEVTSLLEFRDHVLEALPHLHHTRPFHSLTPAPTHDPPPAPRPAPPTTTRAESSPSKAAHAPLSGGEGARQPRAISAGGGGGGGNSSSSSTGGKSLSETHSSSAVADSGFSTDKAGGSMGKSSSSSAGDHLSGADDPRWTSVEPDLPLGSAEDELWHLLDVIQRKGTRLRHELERAERCERDRLSTGPAGGAQGAPHHPHHHHHHHPHLHHPAAPASDPLSSPRHPHPATTRDYWPHSLPGHTAADLLPPPPPPPPVGVALEAEAWAAVDRLRQDRQYLIGRVGWAEAEAAASHQRLVDLHGQLLALAGDKRRLEDQVRALRLDTARPEPLPPAAAVCSSTASTQGGVHTVTILADHAANTTTTTTTRPRRPSPAVTVSVAGSDGGEDGAGGAGRPRVRSASSVRLNADRERDVVLPRVLKVPIKERASRTSTAPPAAPPAPAAPREAAQEEESRRGSDRVVIERERRAGRADGGFSMPVSLLKGARVRVTPNKQRISAILREKDVLELQRQLLTTVMEAEVLKKQIESASEEWATKTSEWESDHRHALAAVTTLKEENSRLKQQLEARPKAAERRDIGVGAAPVMFTTSTMTGASMGGEEEEEDAPTHTVHAGPNVKYDVVVHEERRGDRGESVPRRSGVGVEKPPRRSRDPRNAPSPAPPLRETAESPGGKDSLGRASGARGRGTLSQSGRCTPTGTPRSSPAPSITPRMCTARAAPQDSRASPLARTTVTRSTLHRRDSLKAAQRGGKAAGGGGGGGGGGGQTGGQAKVAPPFSPDQGSVGQPRSMRQAPRSPLTLADLRTPSPAPPPAQATRPATGHRGAKGVSGRRVGGAAGVLHPREASGAGAGAGPGLGLGSGAGRGVRYGSRGTSSPQELRLSHLRPATPSPSPPASCSSFYDSINSEGPPLAGHAPPSPATDRLMQVEVAFEWSPVHPGSHPSTHPNTQIWPCSPITPTHPQWLSSRLPPAHSSRPWPPDSLEATGEPEVGHVEQVGHRGRVEGPRVRPRVRGSGGGGGGGLSPRQDQDLNTRVHQILTRIASGGQ